MVGRRVPGPPGDRETLVPGIVQAIQKRIWQGQLRPGERLNQVDLAKSLGVSLIPFREAMRALAGEGLVQFMPHRGVQVAPVTLLEIEESYLESRGVMMTYLPVAIPLLDAGRMLRLRSASLRLDQEGIPADEHIAFWRLFFEPCALPHLGLHLEQMIQRMGRYYALGAKTVFAGMADLRPNRGDFLDACEAGEVDRAVGIYLTMLEARNLAFQASLGTQPAPGEALT